MKRLNLSSLLPGPFALPFKFNLKPRERFAVTIAAMVLLVLLVLQLIVFPTLDRRKRLKRTIESNTAALQEIQQLKTEYESMTRQTRNTENLLKRRSRSFTLFSFIDQLAGKVGIKNNIEYMKPSTANLKNSPLSLSMVEMKISALTIEQLTNFLYGVEDDAMMVWIKRISIQKGEKNVGLINTTLQVETIQQ